MAEKDSSDNIKEFLTFLHDITVFAKNCPNLKYSDVKERLESFMLTFQQCENKDELKATITKASDVITKVFSELSEGFQQNEPHYVQQFYYHWKEILMCVAPSSIGKCCERNLSQMQTSIRHLQAAVHRLEQMSIMSVLTLYVENARTKKLKSTEGTMLVEILRVGKAKSNKVLHNFIDYVNMAGKNILTIKPTKASSVDLGLNFLEQNHEVWLDFNFKDKSIAFVAHSVIDEKLLCVGIASPFQIKDHLMHGGEYQLLCSGLWTLYCGSVIKQPGKSSKIMFTCNRKDNIKIKSLKRRFKVSEYLQYDQVAGQDKNADLQSIGRSSATLLYHESDNDGDVEMQARGIEEGLDMKSSEFSDDENDISDSVSNCWKYILNDRQIENLLEPQPPTEWNSLAVNHASNERRVHRTTPANHIYSTQKVEFITSGVNIDNRSTAFTAPNRIITRRHSLFIAQRNVHNDSTKMSRNVFMSMDCESRDIPMPNSADVEERCRKRTRSSAQSKPNVEDKRFQVLNRRIEVLEDQVRQLIERNER